MDLHKVIIGAPFGNWFRWHNTTPTIGTYTARKRAGFITRFWRLAATVRYYPRIQAWSNNLKLPSPGIDKFLFPAQPNSLNGKILSVAGFNDEDWNKLSLAITVSDAKWVEINASCPNCPGEDRTNYPVVFKQLMQLASYVNFIVKLPPVGYRPLLYAAMEAGIANFHCCNTLPSPGGGLSGKPLQLLSLSCMNVVRTECKFVNTIIGGGGITTRHDARRFLDNGATHISIASGLFLPWQWPEMRSLPFVLYGS
jgi:dihydroorotate dehydrogenase